MEDLRIGLSAASGLRWSVTGAHRKLAQVPLAELGAERLGRFGLRERAAERVEGVRHRRRPLEMGRTVGELGLRPRQQRLGRLLGPVEQPCGLGQAEAVEVAKRQHGSMLVGEAVQRLHRPAPLDIAPSGSMESEAVLETTRSALSSTAARLRWSMSLFLATVMATPWTGPPRPSPQCGRPSGTSRS